MTDDCIPHAAPKPFPPSAFVSIEVPLDFNKVIVAAAAKNSTPDRTVSYQEQLLDWAQKGAECSRLHEGKKAGRTNRK